MTLMFKELLAYDNVVQHLLTLKQSFLISGSIFMYIICLELNINSKALLLTAYLLISASLYFLMVGIKEHSMKTAAFQKEFKSPTEARRFIVSLFKLIKTDSEA